MRRFPLCRGSEFPSRDGATRWIGTVAAVLWVVGTVAAEPPVHAALRLEHERLLRAVDVLTLHGPYVVIDTHDHRLSVRTRDAVRRVALCATGSGRRLEGRKAWYRWTFDTPRGCFAIIRKVEDPLWIRPTWDFIEAEEEIPVFAEDARRFQRGVLGESALYFLKDFMIHGTLYEINLGKAITHGCVRVGSADLRYLYDTVQVGWPVYIY